jgi:hypothetical protein
MPSSDVATPTLELIPWMQEAITFKIESSTFPNWNGTDQKRTLTIRGDELQYAVTASSAGGSSVVTWKRVK